MTRVVRPVTMLMPIYNGERFVAAAIDSLLAQTFREFILLVIDDGSTDDTRAIVRGYEDPRVRLICAPHRQGPAAARNRGLEEAQTPVIGFLDSDDIAEPHRLERQMAVLREQPGTGMVAAHVAVMDEQGCLTGATWGWNQAEDLIAPSMCFRNALPTSTILVRRDALGEERFDPALEVASDYDMWLRIGRRTRVASLSEPLVRYRVHPSNLTHQRESSAAACLERIARRQLSLMGAVPSHAELTVHVQLAAGRPHATTPFVAAASAWLVRLECENRRSGVYPADAFGRVIETEWLAVCDTAARGGRWGAWPSIVRSPLTRRLIGDPRRRRALARLPWGMLQGSLR